MKYGYARVSTGGQTPALQLAARRKAVAIIAALAVIALYWPRSPHAPIRAHPLYSFRTPEVIGATFAVIMFIQAVAACWHWRKVIEYVGVFLLLIPFLCDAVSTIWGCVVDARRTQPYTMGAVSSG